MSQKTITHLFGEMDLDLDLSFDEIYKKAFDICECCGYMIDVKAKQPNVKLLDLIGCDGEVCKIHFLNNKVNRIKRAQFSDSGQIIKDWHEVKKGSYVSIYEA